MRQRGAETPFSSWFLHADRRSLLTNGEGFVKVRRLHHVFIDARSKSIRIAVETFTNKDTKE
jgi:hypothetical protein